MSISLFLGAGASVQFGLDTTADFKTKLMNNKQHNPNVNQNNKHQQSTFASLINNSNFIDIEEILHAIKGLTENITDPKDFPKHAQLAWNDLTYPQLPQFKQVYESLSHELNSIKNTINDEVFNSYNWDVNNNSLLKLFYSKLFQIIRNNSQVINIGTTNYDQAVENFCVLPNSEYNCHDGFNMHDINLESIFAPDNFDLKNTDAEKIDVRLFKIHGSLNWTQKSNQIFKIFSDKSKINRNERVFISPTLNPKEDVKNEPFNALNTLFNKYLQESQICVIIGYSFRDEHINENFEKFLKNSENQIIIISPNCKSDFVRNYRKTNCITRDMDEAWLKNNKPKNIHFLEYRIESNNSDTVLKELEKKIIDINSKTNNA